MVLRIRERENNNQAAKFYSRLLTQLTKCGYSPTSMELRKF